MTSEGRHEALLWGESVSYPTPVIGHVMIEDGFLLEAALDENISRADDAFWHRFAWRRAFSWQGFINWWVARRWLEPRDITRR